MLLFNENQRETNLIFGNDFHSNKNFVAQVKFLIIQVKNLAAKR